MLSDNWMLFCCFLWLPGLATISNILHLDDIALIAVCWILIPPSDSGLLNPFNKMCLSELWILSLDSIMSLLSMSRMPNWAISICPFVHLSSRFLLNEMPDSSVFVHERKISFRLKVATTLLNVHTPSLYQICRPTFH